MKVLFNMQMTSFAAQSRIMRARVGDEQSTSRSQVQKELEISQEAKLKGVNVPKLATIEVPVKYLSSIPTKDILGIGYVIKGEKADYKENPITKKHFANIFNDFFLLDKNGREGKGLYHGDLDIGHIYYAEDGRVSFDFYRFSEKFDPKNTKGNSGGSLHFPEFMMPSNALNYEKASLGHYLSGMKDPEEVNKTVKTYLQESSQYHRKRAGYLSKIKAPSDMIEFEKLQAKYTGEPDASIVELRKKRIDSLLAHRIAFTKLDEGNGACGHQPNAKERIGSIPLHLNMIKKTIDYIQSAQKLEETETDLEKKKYFEYEKKFGQFWVDKYLEWTDGTALWIITGENNLNRADKADEMNKLYKNIVESPLEEKSAHVDFYHKEFNKLLSQSDS